MLWLCQCDRCLKNTIQTARTCLKCETAVCSLNIKLNLIGAVYADHTLMEPMTERHCLEHKRPILFYCQNHAVCVCDSCITEKHQSHTLLSLDQAQATIKEDLKTDIERLQEEICSIKQDDLKRSEADVKAQVIELKRRLSKRYYDRKKQLEEDEEYILRLIDDEGLRTLSRIKSYSETLTREQERIILIDHDAQSLEQGDSLSFIQNSKPIVSRLIEAQDVTNVDKSAFTLNLSAESHLIQKRLNRSGKRPLMFLDPKTANFYLILSDDHRAVTLAEQEQSYPNNPERFTDYYQVFSCEAISSGSHCWDAESDGEQWGMGIAYDSIKRVGQYSWFGETTHSWCLYLSADSVVFWHDNERTDFPVIPSQSRIRVQLDYETGIVSFHHVTDSLTLLHSFHSTFTEPVFPAFCCYSSSLKLLN